MKKCGCPICRLGRVYHKARKRGSKEAWTVYSATHYKMLSRTACEYGGYFGDREAYDNIKTIKGR